MTVIIMSKKRSRDYEGDDEEDDPGLCSFCSCCNCCKCCCTYWGNIFALNIVDFFLGGLFLGIGMFSFMLVSTNFSTFDIEYHISWLIFPITALGLVRILVSFLSTSSILCNKSSDAEVNRIVYKAYKSNLLLCTTFFVLFLGVLELLLALGMYELKDWMFNHLEEHLEDYGNLTVSYVDVFRHYYDYLNYAVAFSGLVIPLLRYRVSWQYYEDYSRSTTDRDEILLVKKLKRMRKLAAKEEKRKAAEAYEQELAKYNARMEEERLAEEATAAQREIEAKKYRLEQWAIRQVEIEEEKKQKALEAAAAAKKRLVGTDLIIDSMNQQQLLKMGVKVGLAHDAPEPGHLGAYNAAVPGIGSGTFLKNSTTAVQAQPHVYTYYDGGDDVEQGYTHDIYMATAAATTAAAATISGRVSTARGPQTDIDLVVPFDNSEGGGYSENEKGSLEDEGDEGVDTGDGSAAASSDFPTKAGGSRKRGGGLPSREIKLKRVPAKGTYLGQVGSNKVYPGAGSGLGSGWGEDGTSISSLQQSIVTQSQRSLTSLPSDYFTILNSPTIKLSSSVGALTSASTPIGAPSRTGAGGSYAGVGVGQLAPVADEPVYSHPHSSIVSGGAMDMMMVPFDPGVASVGGHNVGTNGAHYLEERALAKLRSEERERLLAGSFGPGGRPLVAMTEISTAGSVDGTSAVVNQDGHLLPEHQDTASVGAGSVMSLGSLGSLTSMIRADTGFGSIADYSRHSGHSGHGYGVRYESAGIPLGFGVEGLNPQQQFRREQEHLFSDDVVYIEETEEDTPREYYHDGYKDKLPELAENADVDEKDGDEEGSIVSALSLDEFDEELNHHHHDTAELSFEAQEQKQMAHEKDTYFSVLNEKVQQKDGTANSSSTREPKRNHTMSLAEAREGLIAAGVLTTQGSDSDSDSEGNPPPPKLPVRKKKAPVQQTPMLR